jgi:hypothetical protein
MEAPALGRLPARTKVFIEWMKRELRDFKP